MLDSKDGDGKTIHYLHAKKAFADAKKAIVDAKKAQGGLFGDSHYFGQARKQEPKKGAAAQGGRFFVRGVDGLPKGVKGTADKIKADSFTFEWRTDAGGEVLKGKANLGDESANSFTCEGLGEGAFRLMKESGKQGSKGNAWVWSQDDGDKAGARINTNKAPQKVLLKLLQSEGGRHEHDVLVEECEECEECEEENGDGEVHKMIEEMRSEMRELRKMMEEIRTSLRGNRTSNNATRVRPSRLLPPAIREEDAAPARVRSVRETR